MKNFVSEKNCFKFPPQKKKINNKIKFQNYTKQLNENIQLKRLHKRHTQTQSQRTKKQEERRKRRDGQMQQEKEEAKCSLLLVSTANSYFSEKSFVFSLSKQVRIPIHSICIPSNSLPSLNYISRNPCKFFQFQLLQFQYKSECFALLALRFLLHQLICVNFVASNCNYYGQGNFGFSLLNWRNFLPKLIILEGKFKSLR